MTSIAVRGLRSLRRHGVAASARRAFELLNPPAIDACQRWYRLDLRAPDRPRRALSEGLLLRRGTADDLERFAQLPPDPSVSELTDDEVLARIERGAEPWLVLEGDRTAFACWNFRGFAPVWGARGGGAPLPPDTVLLEDSVASPDFRGRGVAPGAWSGIADALAAEGVAAITTKVDVENVASCRAVEKAGFREVGLLRVRRRGRHAPTAAVMLTVADASTLWLQALSTF